MSSGLYQLHEVRGQQLVLRSPAGGMRVLSLSLVTMSVDCAEGITVHTPQAVYLVSLEDAQLIAKLLGKPAVPSPLGSQSNLRNL